MTWVNVSPGHHLNLQRKSVSTIGASEDRRSGVVGIHRAIKGPGDLQHVTSTAAGTVARTVRGGAQLNLRRRDWPAGDAGRAALDRLTAKTRSGKIMRRILRIKSRRAIPAIWARYFDSRQDRRGGNARRAGHHRDAVITINARMYAGVLSDTRPYPASLSRRERHRKGGKRHTLSSIVHYVAGARSAANACSAKGTRGPLKLCDE